MAEQRASDDDRERAVEELRRAGGDGRLTLEELDERLGQAHAARTCRGLEELLADLSGPAGPVTVRDARSSGLSVRPGDGGSRWVVSFMSGATRSGRWRMSPRCTVVNVMGSSELDLNDVELAHDVSDMTVFSFMGGSDVRVPEGCRVEVSDFAFFGANDVQRGVTISGPSEGPLIRLRLFSIMGGTRVASGRRLVRAERRSSTAGLPPPPPQSR